MHNKYAGVVYLKCYRTLRLLFHSIGLSDSQHAGKKRTGWSTANNWTASHWWALNWILADKRNTSALRLLLGTIFSAGLWLYFMKVTFFLTQQDALHLAVWVERFFLFFLHIKAVDLLKPFLHACNVLLLQKTAFWPLIEFLKAALWRSERLLPPLGSHDTYRECSLSGLALSDSRTGEVRQLKKSPLWVMSRNKGAAHMSLAVTQSHSLLNKT